MSAHERFRERSLMEKKSWAVVSAHERSWADLSGHERSLSAHERSLSVHERSVMKLVVKLEFLTVCTGLIIRAAHGHFTVICTNYLNQLLNQFLKVNQLLNHYPLSKPCDQFIPYMYYLHLFQAFIFAWNCILHKLQYSSIAYFSTLKDPFA